MNRRKALTRAAVLIIIAVILVAVAGVYLYLAQPRLESQLVIAGPRGLATLGERLAKLYSNQFGINATFVHRGKGTIELLNEILLEKDRPTVDVFLGVPEFYMKPVKDAGLFERYTPPNIGEVRKESVFDRDGFITPFDEFYISIIYNQTALNKLGLAPPKSLDDLLKPEYKGLVTYPNPVTSGTGLSVLTWIISEKGEQGAFQFLKELSKNVARVGYPTGFTPLQRALVNGEVGVVLSFTTHTVDSTTPHMRGGEQRGFAYREGVAVIKNAKNKEAAKKFVEFSISKSAQDLMDPLNFGFPVRPGGQLKNLVNLKTPTQVVVYDQTLSGKADDWRERWRREILGG